MPPIKPATSVYDSSTPNKTYTNWKAFDQAKLVVTSAKCESYRPVFLHDGSCHSNLILKAENFIRHIQGDHGGGFRLFVKAAEANGKASPLWQELADAGLEAHDFRCEICDKQLRFAPSSFIGHLKAHSGKTRRVNLGGVFNVVLSLAKPEDVLDEDDAA